MLGIPRALQTGVSGASRRCRPGPPLTPPLRPPPSPSGVRRWRPAQPATTAAPFLPPPLLHHPSSLHATPAVGRPWKGGSASPGHGSGLTRWLAASPLLSAWLLPVRRPLCPRGRAWDCFWEPQLLPLASGLAGGDGSALPGSRSAPPPRLVATSSPCCGVDAPGLRGAWGWPPGCRAAPAGCRAAG